MKKIMVVTCIILFQIPYADAGVTHWLKQGWQTTKGLAHAAIDRIETILLNSSLNIELVKQYKQKSDALQVQLDQIMTQFEKTEDEELLKQANQTLEELKAEQDTLLAQAKDELSTQEFDLLQEAIRTNQTIAAIQVQKSTITAAIYNTLKGYGINQLEESINAKNPYALMSASVKRDPGLSYNEKKYLNNRKIKARQALSTFFGQQLSPAQEFNLAFSGSGGGLSSYDFNAWVSTRFGRSRFT